MPNMESWRVAVTSVTTRQEEVGHLPHPRDQTARA